MNKEKTFIVKKPSQIPDLPTGNQRLQVSDLFLALVKTIQGTLVYSATRYDFKKSKWLFPYSGQKELIEYYTPKN